MSVRMEYRAAITDALGVAVACALYMESIDDSRLVSYPGTGQIQIGIDYRWKL